MKKKMNDVKHGERNFGIFLVIIEIIAILGACNNDSGLPKEFFRLLGFLLPGIIGVLFIIRDYTKKREKGESYQCPECKNPTSSNWSGLLIVTNPEESDVAKELGITKAGEYALRVR